MSQERSKEEWMDAYRVTVARAAMSFLKERILRRMGRMERPAELVQYLRELSPEAESREFAKFVDDSSPRKEAQ